MNVILNEIEIRVLGSLVEKEITTPEYYPLSLNALCNACNQKSNRDPVMSLDEDSVREALDHLNGMGLAAATGGAGSRVTKYEHRLQEVFNLHRQEAAILCILMLRGAQTPGELRGRSERMHRFEDLDQVQSALQMLIKRDPPLAKLLAKAPGTKEARYTHLLSGDVPELAQASTSQPHAGDGPAINSPDGDRVACLENEVRSLRKEVTELRQTFLDFRKQFD